MMKVKMAMPQAERSAEDAAQLKAAFKSVAELQPTRGKSETPPRCGGADVDAGQAEGHRDARHRGVGHHRRGHAYYHCCIWLIPVNNQSTSSSCRCGRRAAAKKWERHVDASLFFSSRRHVGVFRRRGRNAAPGLRGARRCADRAAAVDATKPHADDHGARCRLRLPPRRRSHRPLDQDAVGRPRRAARVWSACVRRAAALPARPTDVASWCRRRRSSICASGRASRRVARCASTDRCAGTCVSHA